MWNTHAIAYHHDTDKVVFDKFLLQYPQLAGSVSQQTFVNYKPFWLRPAKWLTCRCPKCYEIEAFYKAYTRVVHDWHEEDARSKGFTNARPEGSSLDLEEETHCWQCRLHNPFYELQPSPSPAVNLEKLYNLAMCERSRNFTAETSRECAHGLLCIACWGSVSD